VGGSVNRATGLGRAGVLGRGSLGATRGFAVSQGELITTRQTDAPARHQRQLTIEQTNRDRRIAQAQHLREIAARNGNAELAANADRMEALALQHYQERAEHLARFGVADAPSPDAAADAPADDPAPTPDPPTP
jgi:hypothetical protein